MIIGTMTSPSTQSPVIHRCSSCGALVHPATGDAAAWCSRCQRVVGVDVDGGEDG